MKVTSTIFCKITFWFFSCLRWIVLQQFCHYCRYHFWRSCPDRWGVYSRSCSRNRSSWFASLWRKRNILQSHFHSFVNRVFLRIVASQEGVRLQHSVLGILLVSWLTLRWRRVRLCPRPCVPGRERHQRMWLWDTRFLWAVRQAVLSLKNVEGGQW